MDYQFDTTLEEYKELLGGFINESYRVLEVGGRCCINIANVHRKPYVPVNAIISTMMVDSGWLMRGEVIWNKASSAGGSTAWGSWRSSTNPTLRDVHEYILIFSKGQYKRNHRSVKNVKRDDFLEYTKSVWSFPTASARRIGHPAPFSLELPSRLIKLYSFKGDTILDPFMGSGQTGIAALQLGRNYIGYETSKEYVELANRRILESQR
jgi:site-specific DNA-methyltransferase (adenine-specific)